MKMKAVTIYIIIPLLIIPQMIMGGAMFSFDKLNSVIASKDKVPLIAEFVTARWAYEGLMVDQFAGNAHGQRFFETARMKNHSHYMITAYINALEEKLQSANNYLKNNNSVLLVKVQKDIELLKAELKNEVSENKTVKFCCADSISLSWLKNKNIPLVKNYFTRLRSHYSKIYNEMDAARDRVILSFDKTRGSYQNFFDTHNNEAVELIVRKGLDMKKIAENDGRLVQLSEPVFRDSGKSLRSHLFAYRKYFAGSYFSTYFFNVTVIWLFTLFLFIALYFNLLSKLINIFTWSFKG